MVAIPFMMSFCFANLLDPSITWASLDLIWLIMSIRFAKLCMTQRKLIGLHSKEYCIIFQHTKDVSLLLHRHSAHSLQTFSDANWAGCPNDRRSTAGIVVYLGNNLISWVSKKQKTVARSSTESEYKVLADTTIELRWLQSLLLELQCPVSTPPILWCDNVGAAYLASNPIFHARTEHIEIDYRFVHDMVANKEIQVQFIAIADNIVDVPTKGLSRPHFEFLRSKFKVVFGSPLARGRVLNQDQKIT